jgi:hypothetical protein
MTSVGMPMSSAVATAAVPATIQRRAGHASITAHPFMAW